MSIEIEIIIFFNSNWFHSIMSLQYFTSKRFPSLKEKVVWRIKLLSDVLAEWKRNLKMNSLTITIQLRQQKAELQNLIGYWYATVAQFKLTAGSKC